MNPIQQAWLWLSLGVVAEVLGTVGLKLSSGFSRFVPGVASIVCYACAIASMALATSRVEIGVAYATWAVASTALTAAIGIVCFGERVSSMKLLGIALAVGSLVLLNLHGDGDA